MRQILDLSKLSVATPKEQRLVYRTWINIPTQQRYLGKEKDYKL